MFAHPGRMVMTRATASSRQNFAIALLMLWYPNLYRCATFLHPWCALSLDWFCSMSSKTLHRPHLRLEICILLCVLSWISDFPNKSVHNYCIQSSSNFARRRCRGNGCTLWLRTSWWDIDELDVGLRSRILIDAIDRHSGIEGDTSGYLIVRGSKV